MTGIKRNPAVRMLAVLLALAMLFGLLAISAQAADVTNVKQYNHYVCIGDSIAAGYGSYGRDVKGFVRIPAAYHSLVADATGAQFQSLAHTGMRTVEARWLLDDDYSASLEAANLRAMYSNGMSDYLFWLADRTGPDDPAAESAIRYQVSEPVQQALKGYYGEFGLKNFYRDNIAKADLITLALGVNDIFLYAMKQTAAELGNLNLITEVLEYLRYMTIGYKAFMANWAPMIHAIKRLSPNGTIVVVGIFNPFKKVNLSSNAQWANVGVIAQGLVTQANNYMKRQASTLGYLFADVTATETDDTVPFTDPTFFDRIVMDSHPTVEGHQYMAQQILAQLPVRSENDPVPGGFPFRDVGTWDWFYSDVYDCWENGIMDGMEDHLFVPQGITTRAQFATVLYRMANSPNVSGLRCPFTDVKPGSWYENAVIWGYNTGVINGTSDTTFSPDQSVTREQMVTMLFRYSGAGEPTGSLSMFSDAWRVSDYALPAVVWAVQNGIVNGMEDGTFRPQGYATRAQLARVLHMYRTVYN